MEKNEYIEFEVNNLNKFNDLIELLNLIFESKNNEDFKTDKYWLDKFPNYALRHYYFGERDLKPQFKTHKPNDGTWHFYSMIEHLLENIEIEFLGCKKIEEKKGRLEFYAFSYPYGGITGLTMFLKSFGFSAQKIDDGTGIYKVKWKNETEFELK
ncbi:conserved protein of unknown function [Tenacibaculum sp. 190524A02b]|uniref:hypothetical protein n=1 Tax=Tenacibaculum vairaonense TaxID=3137860 RepID=UPI0032B1D56E